MSPIEVKRGDFIIPHFDIHSRFNSDVISLIKGKKYTIFNTIKWDDKVVIIIDGEEDKVKIYYNQNTHNSYDIFSLKEERLRKLKGLL